MAQGFAGSGQSILSGGLGVSTGGNTAGNTGTTVGTVVLAAINNITLSQSTAAGSLATITISGRDAIFGAGVSTGGNTSGTTGTVTGTLVLAGGNNVTLSQSTNASGATITISAASAAAATVVSGIGVSTGGNTSGDTGTTVGTVVLAAINNITLSQSTAAGSLATISISGRNAVFGAGISTGGNTSGTSGTNTGTFVLAGGNGITLSQATGAGGNTVTISGITQSTQPAVNVAAGTQTATSGTVILSNSNGISFGMSNSSVVTATADYVRSISAGTTNATGNQIVLSNSNNVSFGASGATITATVTVASTQASINISAGTTSNLASAFTFSNSNNVSFGLNASTITASFSQSVQPGVTAIGVSTGGNTSGNTGTTQGTYILAGGNNITLSQVTAAGSLATVTISGPNMFQAGVSTGGNTSGSTGTVSQQVVFVGGNNVTLSQSTGGVSSATITISAANSGTVVSGIGVSTGGNTSGNTGTTVGTVVFAGGNQITLSQSTAAGSLATITISGRDAIFGAGVSTGGNTSGTTGTVTGTLVLAGGNNITLSQSTNASGATITVSAANSATVVSAFGVSTGGNTSGNTGTTVGTVVLAGGNNITLSQSTAAGSLATITVSARDAIFGAGISTGGNTSGTSGTVTGTLVFAGLGEITLSQSTNASGATITISAASDTAASVVSGIGVSTGGNTSGDTGTTIGTVVFAAINNITLSQSTAAGSLATITISGRNAVFGAGISTGGNTSGTSGTNTGTFVLVGGNNITLSQATGAGGNTVTISAPNGLAISAGTQSQSTGTVIFSNSNQVTFGMSNSSVVTASIGNVATTVSAFSHNAEWISNFTVQQGILSLQRVTIPANVTMSTAVLLMDLTGNSNSTGGITVSVGIYTLSGSTASLSTSFSNNTTWTSGSATSASAQYGGNSGTRYRGVTFNTLLTQGDYLFGIYALTTNNGTWRVFGRQGVSIVGQLSTPVNVTQAFIDGVSTSSFTTAMPASINVTDTNYNRTGVSAQRQPGFMLLGE